MHPIRTLSVAVCLTALSALSFAQTTGTRTPDTVGVDPADARAAMERARQREAEATVVPIDGTATQRTRDTAATTDRTTGSTLGADRPAGARPARADRN